MCPAGRRRQDDRRRLDPRGPRLTDRLERSEDLPRGADRPGPADRDDERPPPRPSQIRDDAVDERRPLRSLVGRRHVDRRPEQLVETLVRAGRVDRRTAQHEMDVEAGPRSGRGRQPAMVRPAPSRRDQRVGALGQRRTDKELQVPQLVPAERERQQVLALDPDLDAAAERRGEPLEPMERRRALEQPEPRQRGDRRRRIGWEHRRIVARCYAAGTAHARRRVTSMSDRVLYRDGALADARSDRLQVGVSILVDDGVIRWIRPTDAEEDPGPADGLELVDAGGATIVPGMVDSHSHVTLPGGAHWIDRIAGGAEVLLEVAERNGRLLTGAGVRWARDVGAPYLVDPVDGRRRALSLGVRDRWRGRVGYPHMRAAGTWLDKRRLAAAGRGHWSRRRTADELLANAIGQLDDGADFLKLYLDGPGSGRRRRGRPPRSRRVVDAAHARGAKVTAHCGPAVGRAGGRRRRRRRDRARVRARRGRRPPRWPGGARSSSRRWPSSSRGCRSARRRRCHGSPSADGRKAIAGRGASGRSRAVRLAQAAGVAIASGTDFGGGSLRANQLAWEVESLVAAGLEPWEALGGRDVARRRAARTSPTPARSPRVGPPTSSSSTATRCPSRPRCGGSGGSPGRADERPAAYSIWRLLTMSSSSAVSAGYESSPMSALTRRIVPPTSTIQIRW